MPDEFLNPYGFVSIPDRETLPDELADRPPAGHDRYREELWTGDIPITMTTITPLLIPDHWAAARNDPGTGPTPTLPVRVDDAGRPILSGSAVKGMLRSAYEAVTNSRFGVFTGHDLPLAIRATATKDVADRLRPAVVVARDQDSARIQWVDELVPTEMDSDPQPNPAVWVPVRLRPDLADGQEVEAWIHLLDYSSKRFRIWRASDVALPGKLPSSPSKAQTSGNLVDLGHPPVRVRGLLHRTGSLFPADTRKKKKHDERLVVTKVLDGPARLTRSNDDEGIISPELVQSWQAVIDSFARAHKNEPRGEVTRIYGSYVWEPEPWQALKIGRTLHVELDRERRVVGLFPAMIGRKPFAGNPIASLPTMHRPARMLAELSPADRVFGWVRQGSDDGEAAYRGHLRVDPGARPGKDTIRTFAERLPLATLNNPKPAQFLFYLGDRHGQPLEGTSKRADLGYPTGPDALNARRLRGRKVYLTHADVLDSTPYWDPAAHSAEPIELGKGSRYREYQAPEDHKEQVTTTVSQWVVPGAEFRFTLRVDNLSDTELGALLWLLDLPSVDNRPAYHKLGLGKPLGFGVVRVAADLSQARLYTGGTLRDRYRSLAATPPAEPASRLAKLRKDYNTLMRGNPALKDVRKEFLAAAAGCPGYAVHYPRLSPPPAAKSYEWWVANDKTGDPKGARHALPGLRHTPAPVLPYDPSARDAGHRRSVDHQGGRGPQPRRQRQRRD